MQAKSTNSKKSPKQINSYPYQPNDYDEGEFELMSQGQDSDYRAEESQPKQTHTGRRQTNHYERQRRTYKSNQNVVLSQLFDVKTMGEMAIFRNLFEGVETWEILDFLGEYRVFLQVLKLQMEDRSLCFEIDSFINHDFKKDFLYEPVPRTFICGLMRLKELRKSENGNHPFQVTETEIKALFMTSLLLINVGQIPKKWKTQKNDEPSEVFFHRIVSYLLDQSGFLTPKLFYYISLNWSKIIEMIVNQFEADRDNSNPLKKTQQKQQNLNQDLSRLKIDEKTKISLNAQESIEEIYQNEHFSEEELIHNQDSMGSLKSERKRGCDMEFRFLSESKKSEKIERSQRISENHESGSNKFKRQCPIIVDQGEIDTKKRVKLNQSDPAIQKAIKYYNFGQFNTRDRTRNQKRKPRKAGQNRNQKKQNGEAKKGKKMVEQKEQQKVVVSTGSQQFSCLDEDFENIFEGCNYDERYSFRRKDSISSLDYIFEEAFRSSSYDEYHKMSSEEESLHNQQDQTEEGPVMEVQEAAEETGNVNRKVKHEKREIDYMIKAIIKDRFVMIQSIACQIYHSLRVMNAEVVQDRRRYYRRNLTEQFEQY